MTRDQFDLAASAALQTSTDISPMMAGNSEALAFMRERAGMIIHDHQLPVLRQCLAACCERFGDASALAFINRVKDLPANAPEIEFMVARLTVGETYFFRDQAQMRFLKETWFPEQIERKSRAGEKSLRVWSAGCSSGEEIYSIAMMLRDLLGPGHDWTLQLIGTDINNQALAKAALGRYSEWSMRAISERDRSVYLTHEPNGEGSRSYAVNDEVREMVSFHHLNLAEDHYPSLATSTMSLDLILCRNVFIYLSRETINRIMERFARCLKPTGAVLLAPTDLVSVKFPGFNFVSTEDISYFAREADASAALDLQASVNGVETPAARGSAPGPAALKKSRVGRPRKQSPPKRSREERPRKQTPPPAPSNSSTDRDLIIAALRDERWNDVVTLTDRAVMAEQVTAEYLQFKAKAMANLGALDNALALCDQSMQLDQMDYHIHFLRGLVLLGLNDLSGARQSFEKTLYLNWHMPEAHLQLGMLMIRMGDRARGQKQLRHALDEARAAPPTRPLHNAPGMTYGRLCETLREDFEFLQAEEQATGSDRRMA